MSPVTTHVRARPDQEVVLGGLSAPRLALALALAIDMRRDTQAEW